MSGSKIQKVMLATMLGGALFAAGCSPIINQHGYLPISADVAAIAVGSDTKDSVSALLGAPTTKGVQGDNSWYYISYSVRQFAFFAPKITDRQILAITFNGANRVAQIDNYGLEDGLLIDLNTGETATGGRSLGFFEQMIGNIGNFSAESFI